MARDIEDLEMWRGLAEKSCYHARALSREMRISRRQLERYTRQMFGVGPQHWLNEQRLGIAHELLIKEGSVKAVAFQLGYKWVSQFSREFKSHYGRSPRAFLAVRRREPGRHRPGNSPENRYIQVEFPFR